MKVYCLGFLYTDDCSHVVLLHKERPEWQANRLNGCGGKVESNETPVEAMARECLEELGVFIPWELWEEFATMRGPDWLVHCFRTRSSKLARHAHACTDEKPVLLSVADPRIRALGLSNVPWLTHMGADGEYMVPVTVEYP